MTTDFIHGRPMKQIVLFSLPIMLSSLLQYTYNMVDNIIVGRYVSTNALAAVGNIAPISSFAIGAAFGLTAGFTIPVAQCFGAGDQEETNRQAGNGIGTTVVNSDASCFLVVQCCTWECYVRNVARTFVDGLG